MARIALVHDIAGVAALQAKILRDAGHVVDQIHLPETGASWSWPAKAITIPIRVAGYLPAVLKLRRERYDVIHVHWVTQGIAGVLASRPFFLQAHGSDLHVNLGIAGLGPFSRWILNRAEMVFYVTPNLAAYLRGHATKIRYLPNPIDVDGLVSAKPLPATVSRVLIFTRLDAVKGPERIFPAAERLAEMVELTGLAWGPLKADYMPRYERLVRFAEPVAHGQVGALIAQFDAVVGQMRQGILSLSEIEVLAVGRPLITGIDWSLYPDDPPPVIAATGPDEIVRAVEQLRDDRELTSRLCREGPDWVRRNHGFARHLQLLEDAYFGPERAANPPRKP